MRDTSLYEPDRHWAVGITVLRQISSGIPLYPYMMRRHSDVCMYKRWLGMYNIARKSHNPLRGKRVRFQWVTTTTSVPSLTGVNHA